MTYDDPLHLPGGSTTYWTTINAEENLPGVVTPLSGSFWLRPVTVGTLGAFVDLGVLLESEARFSDAVDERIASIFHGRFSANVSRLRSCADKTPGTSGDALEEQLFANARPGIPKEGAPWRYPIVAVKAPRAAATIAARIHGEFPRSQDWWRRSVQMAQHDDLAKARKRLAAAHDHMAAMMRPHTLATFMTQGVFDQIKELAKSAGRPGLDLELSSGLGALEEVDMLAQLWDVSRGQASLEQFLEVYGFHGSGEAAASAPVWRENPGALEPVLASYRAMSEDRAPRAIAQQVAAKRRAASEELMASLPASKRPLARLLLKLGDRYWPLRETGKATLLHSIDVGRAASRRLGDLLAERGLTDKPDDVNYLTVEELVAGEERRWQDDVAFRRARREEYLKYELPQTWEGEPEPLVREVDEEPDTSVELVALAGSPGVVEGVVRVVHDLLETDLEDGEVLVCETTDPSWASLFLVAGALIIDVGSPMSHGAIVAREMGLPCVINTRTGTRRLRDGDRVRVDGDHGRVEVLERAALPVAETPPESDIETDAAKPRKTSSAADALTTAETGAA